MSKFVNLIEDYRAGKISAFDLYRNLPLDMQKSVDGALIKSKTEDDEGREDQEAGDLIYPEKKDLEKFAPAVAGGTANTAPPATASSATSPSGLALSLNDFVGSRAQLKKSVKAQESRMTSLYGNEVIRKSGVGSPCIICNKLHKSIKNICTTCSDSMNSTAWHKNSHLE